MSASAPVSMLPLFSFPPGEEPSAEDSIEAQFQRFHAQHPEVYDELVKLCRRAKQRGSGRIGIGMLWEVLRWRRHLRGLPDETEEFKLNNNYRSRYAREIMRREPDLRDVFVTRELQSA